ncbi:16S rRNA (uracil(1498)-N(3))-methyltransferase [Pelagibacteraceae bacterium]|nr:16S rRNA (uracil(1498)-N(3))-methyltransferase [Pelagibacteraceae bacterium]
MNNIRLHYVESIVENSTSLVSREHSHYIVNVMRLKKGSNINFFNKEGEWLSEIISIEKDKVEIKFLNKVKEPSKISNIELAICLVKKTPMENILQKATELGVRKITPIISDRTEIKDLNFERANRITIDATEQSNQLNIPEISQIIKLKDFINNISKDEKLFFADVNSKHKPISKDLGQGKKISILIGPEGDFSPAERELILSKPGTVPFSLSENILRTDTAVISAISLVTYIHINH